VAIDETKLKIKERHILVWASIDADTRELLAVYASYYRSSINTIVFVKRVLDTCVGTPVVLVDGGPWYPWALDRMDWDTMAPHHVRPQERNREVIQYSEGGEDQTLLQQPAIRQTGQSRILLEPVHVVVQPPEEASGIGKNPCGGELIVTVSTGRVGSKVITRAVLGDWRASRRWLFREKERRYNKKGAS